MTSGLGLKKEDRIFLKKDFSFLLRKGKTIRLRFCKIIWCIKKRSEPEVGVKFGVSVPKKKISKATQRNKIKRRVREVYRTNRSILSVKPNYQVLLLVVHTNNEPTSFKELETDIIEGLNLLSLKTN